VEGEWYVSLDWLPGGHLRPMEVTVPPGHERIIPPAGSSA
jgi:hypothetical protein